MATWTWWCRLKSLELSAQGLKDLGINAETHMSHGIGHGIDQDGLQRGGVFLARAFAARP